MNQKVHVACNFNCLIKTERLLKYKVTNSHVHCACGNISRSNIEKLLPVVKPGINNVFVNPRSK